MKVDLLVMTAGILAVGAVTWAFWGNPVNVPRPHSRAALSEGSNLMLASQRTTYMQSER